MGSLSPTNDFLLPDIRSAFGVSSAAHFVLGAKAPMHRMFQ
jgi:hypothetical protein